ncbi:hypothetical protein EAH87_04905 [Sphingomonas koreensis]|nr:hypothetical protein EAH87_04905 [Sphingomonas koreensis]
MSDRVSVSITIGGDLAASARDRFVAAIADEGLSVEWDGPDFDASMLPSDGGPLWLCAHEVAWGRLDDLEALCVELGLPSARWSGGYGRAWAPERVVFTGSGAVVSYACDEDDRLTVDRGTVERLGTLAGVLARFDAADFVVPPLRLTG